MKPVQQKKVPERKCMGCNTKKPKKEMLRIVRTPEGEVFADPTGKKSGRGVYICCNSDCLKKVIKTGRLEKSLETAIPQQVYTDIENTIKEVGENES